MRLGIFFDGIEIPPKSGIPYRFYYLSKVLAEKGVEVVVFLCDRFNADKEELKKLPFEFHLFSPELAYYDYDLVKAVVKSAGVDILQVDHVQTSLWFAMRLSEELKIPLVTEMHDIDFRLKKSLGADSTEIAKQRFLQYASGQGSDQVICVCPDDYKYLIEMGIPRKKIVVAPNGIDGDYYSYHAPDLKSKKLVFLGNMFYPPNRSAAELIVKKIMPKLPKDYTLECIGMIDSEFAKKLSSKRIRFTGPVEDIRPYMQEAALAIAPITQGSGMKVKMLNFAAMGVPIVTTSEGIAGYPQEMAVVEDRIDKYPELILSLMTNPNQLIRNSQRARSIVTAGYGWDAIANNLISMYEKLHFKHKKNILVNGISTKLFKEKANLKMIEGKHVPLPIWLEDEERSRVYGVGKRLYERLESTI
jgi:glycosyltransferase involved in cell wall biosynthesis